MGIIKKRKPQRNPMSSQIKLVESLAHNIVLPKLQSPQSAYSQEKFRSQSNQSIRHSSSTQSTELLKIPNKCTFHARSSSRGIEKSISISDDTLSTTAASYSCIMSQNPSSNAAIMPKAFSMDITNSFLDGDKNPGILRYEEEQKSVQNFLTLDRIAKEKRIPKERCHSQAAKLTMNDDRESDINIRAARMKADRSLSRIDTTIDDIGMTL